MHKRIAGLLGAMGVMVAALPTFAAPANAASVPDSMSYAGLFRPIPAASNILPLTGRSAAERPGSVVLVQYRHHHHRHHHHYHSAVVLPDAPKPT